MTLTFKCDLGPGARVSEYFYKESKSKMKKKNVLGWGADGGAEVSDFVLL